MKKFTGGCLCGDIEYEINGSIGSIINCHCSECRKWHGSAFRTRASVKSEYFRWTKGEGNLGRFSHTPQLTRTFCKICGSSLVSFYRDHPETVGLALGTLNEDPGHKAEFHVYVGSKAPWFDITDDLPQLDAVALGDSRVFNTQKK